MAELQEALQRRRQMEAGSIWASEIKPRLYLGRGQDARNLQQLHHHGITHILNVADDVENFHPNDFTYANLNVTDFGGDVGIRRVFPQAKEFVKSAWEDNEQNKVLVHCANGSNRSATVIIALVMMLSDVCVGELTSLKEAYDLVKGKHPSAVPLRDNRAQLVKFEREIRGTNSMTEEEF